MEDRVTGGEEIFQSRESRKQGWVFSFVRSKGRGGEETQPYLPGRQGLKKGLGKPSVQVG